MKAIYRIVERPATRDDSPSVWPSVTTRASRKPLRALLAAFVACAVFASTLLASALFVSPATAFAVSPEDLGDAGGEIPELDQKDAPDSEIDVECHGAPTRDRLLVRLKDGAARPFSMLSGTGEGSPPEPIPYADGYFVAESLADIQDWLDAGLVEYVGPDAELELLGDLPDDPRIIDQWYLDLIEAIDAWDSGLTGDGVTVAVIDSGIYRAHEDLNYDRISGYSFLGLAENYDSYDDRTGHGTFVTGLLAAEMGNAKGIAGLTPLVNILALRCFSNDGVGDYNSGSGLVSTVLSAIGYAIEQNVDIINMSFGGTDEAILLPLKDKLEEAADKGIILVAAAGNNGTGTLVYPAAYDGVIGVGMVNSAGTVDPKSQRNDSVFVTAPGSGVLSLGYSSPQSYSTGTGTSYATPMVSAMAAMVKQVNRAIDGRGFEALLRASCVDKGDEGYDTSYGWGLVNVGNLVDALSRPLNITYECNGGSLSGEPGSDYAVEYTVDRTDPVVLPIPERDGHVFAGWFDDAGFVGEAVTVVPPSSVGDLVYYAKWIEVSSVAMSSVTVLGIPAEVDESDSSGMTYLVELPAGTDLGAITADDIVAVPVNGMPTEITMVPGSEGAAWNVFFLTADGYPVTYVVRIAVSSNAAPWVAESQESQTGLATPASYDGKTEAIPYTADLSAWFEDDGEVTNLAYLVSTCDGSGSAAISGAEVTYVPSIGDAGKTVTVTLRADDGQFLSSGHVTVSIDVGSIPVSDSTIEPTKVTFDKRTGLGVEIPVTVKLYGNTLVSVEDRNAPLRAGIDYTFSTLPAIEGGEGLVILTSDYVASLPIGVHSIFFNFSDGRDEASRIATLTMEIVDSTPKYTVVFFNRYTEYHRVTGVRDGDTVALPTPPEKKGNVFAGWFTEQEGKGFEVTATTPITAELGPVDGVVALYVKWTPSGGSGGTGGGGSGGSGGSGGGGGGGGLPFFPPMPPSPTGTLPPLVPLWQCPFVDVTSDDWFYASVEHVYSRGLFEGVSADRFSPNDSMTRAMLVTVIHRLAGLPQGLGDGSPFDDVPEGTWYENAVRWAHNAGVVTGSGSRFNPNDSVTREEIVTMLYRYATTLGLYVGASDDILLGFADHGQVSPWARDAMAWAVRAGIIQGKSGGRLDPKGTATRAEVAAIMHRLSAWIA